MGIEESLADRHTYGWTEGVAVSCGILTEPVIRIIDGLGARRVLDAGCGNGTLAGELARRGFDVVGVDADREGIDIARRMHPGIDFRCASFEERPPGVFDAVVSTEVIEHLFAPHELASYAYSALCPGGYFVISTPYHGYLKNLAIVLVNGWDAHFTAQWCGGHIKFWSRQTLSKLLEIAGFEVLEFRGVGRVPFLWMSMILVARRR